MGAFTGAASAAAPSLLAFLVLSSSLGLPSCRALRTGRSLLSGTITHADLALKACSLALQSEEKLSTNGRAPGGLAESVVQGRWAYQQTSSGVLKHSSLPSESGQFDLWVERATPSSLGGTISDVHTVISITSQTDADSFAGSVTIKGQGYYDPERGLLCLLGCAEDERRDTSSSLRSLQTSSAALDLSDGARAISPASAVTSSEPVDVDDLEEGVMSSDGATHSGSQEAVCGIRVLLRFRLTEDASSAESEVSGRLESLRPQGEVPAFTPIVIRANTGAISSQVMWFQLEMLTEAVLCAVQAACIIVQIVKVRKDPEAHYISLTMLSVQIFVYASYWIRSVYYPLRYLNSEILLYFLSDLANIPRFVEFLIFVLYVYLAVLVDIRRRRVAKARRSGGSGEGAGEGGGDGAGAGLLGAGASSFGPQGLSERPLALLFWPLYVLAGACMSLTFQFDTFLRESTFLFLLPQLLANYAWDLPAHSVRAVTWVYVLGNTAAQVAWLTYEVVRPRLMGYDAFFAFPHAWLWSSMLLMLIQLVIFILQGTQMGGRLRRAPRPAPSPKAEPPRPMFLTTMVQP